MKMTVKNEMNVIKIKNTKCTKKHFVCKVWQAEPKRMAVLDFHQDKCYMIDNEYGAMLTKGDYFESDKNGNIILIAKVNNFDEINVKIG